MILQEEVGFLDTTIVIANCSVLMMWGKKVHLQSAILGIQPFICFFHKFILVFVLVRYHSGHLHWCGSIHFIPWYSCWLGNLQENTEKVGWS